MLQKPIFSLERTHFHPQTPQQPGTRSLGKQDTPQLHEGLFSVYRPVPEAGTPSPATSLPRDQHDTDSMGRRAQGNSNVWHVSSFGFNTFSPCSSSFPRSAVPKGLLAALGHHPNMLHQITAIQRALLVLCNQHKPRWIQRVHRSKSHKQYSG